MSTNNKQSGDSLKAPVSCSVLSKAFDTSILYQAVKNPEGVPENEWAAQKVMDLFKDAQMAWGFVSNVCHCPLMRAHFMVFKWQEDPKKAALPLPATVYVKSLFLWIDSQISDTTIFPLKPGVPFSKDFQSIVKNLLRRLFRVYSHIYCHHWPHIESITAVAHVNYCLKHFVYTVLLNNLLECNELKPLEELAKYIIEEGASNEIKSKNSSVKIENKNNEDKNKIEATDKVNIRNDISSPDTHIPSTNSLTADSPLSNNRLGTRSSQSKESSVSKNIKIQASSYIKGISKIDGERLQSTCSDSLIIATKKTQGDKKDTSIYSRKIKTYPWTEFAKKLILCTKRKKKEGKVSCNEFSTPPQITSENL